MRTAIRLFAVAAALLFLPAAGAAAPGRADPACVARNLRIPKALAPHLPDRVYLHYEVGADGKVGPLTIAPEAANARLKKLLDASLRKCRAPGAVETAPGQYALALHFEP